MPKHFLVRTLIPLIAVALVAPAIPVGASSACEDRSIEVAQNLGDTLQPRSSASTVGEVCWKLGEQLEGNRDLVDSFSPHECLDENAVPVGETVVGNGGGAYQFYQSPFGYVYVSWVMQTNNINNGADRWFFGVEIDNGNPRNLWEFRQGTCKFVGYVEELGSFEYLVDGGAGGWTAAASCEITVSWEVNVGISLTATGPEASGSTTLGGSLSCGAGVTFDTESLFHDSGRV